MLSNTETNTVVSKEFYTMSRAYEYVLHESGEAIHYLVYSGENEFCFTNLGLIHVSQASADISYHVKRYSYNMHPLTGITLSKTEGTHYRIHFLMGETPFVLTVNDTSSAELKTLFNSLHQISETLYENRIGYDYVRQSLEWISSTIGHSSTKEIDVKDTFTRLNQHSTDWVTTLKSHYYTTDYGYIFEKAING